MTLQAWSFMNCTDSDRNGCGEHATCKEYLEYYDERREDYKQRERMAAANTYVRDAIERVKHGTRCTLKNYRPKEGK